MTVHDCMSACECACVCVRVPKKPLFFSVKNPSFWADPSFLATPGMGARGTVGTVPTIGVAFVRPVAAMSLSETAAEHPNPTPVTHFRNVL